MSKYLGEFNVLGSNRKISRNGASFIEIYVDGNHGPEVAYCFVNLDEYADLVINFEEISIDGTRISNENKAFIKVNRIRMGLNHLQRVYTRRLADMQPSVEDEFCDSLIGLILHDEELSNAFVKAPGSLKGHHAYIGGLLVHTVETMEMVETLCGSNKFRDKMDISTALTGAFLHDIGKVLCYTINDFDFRMNDVGKNIGHVNMGYRILMEKAGTIDNFPEELLDKLANIILSHHSNGLVLPMSMEAELVSSIDNISAKIGA
jgi:hypothetical protein